jgi:bifunctional UDP-N-acetylglucosamine pyrophosphorylase/glucosamine-1-phosphate N-acetyltransferase
VLYGDTPLIRAETIRAMDQELGHADLVVVSFTPDDPGRYGRLIEDQAGNVVAIREHADASAAEREIRTCFSGLMALGRARDLDLLDDLRPDNAQGEYYLTDLVAIGRGRGLTIRAVEVDPVDVVGVNSRAELAVAEEAMQERLRARAMAEGATLVAPRTVQLSHDTVLESDVLVEPNVVFGPGVRVRQGARIRAFSHLEASEIESGAIVGPFARLRPGAHIGEGAHIGNFVEIKNAIIDEGAKANHLSYIGDAHVGAGANIGAGTITCNYDGFAKHHTEIGAGAFIGSNSSLVAPVSVGEGAYVASGSVVTRVVEAGALAVARGRQENKPGWAERYRELQARPRKARKVGGPDRSE